MDYFTSDMHYGHANIIDYCNRPFESLDEMTNEMVNRWNEIVTEDDTVYVVGDVFLCPTSEGESIVKRLNGRKILIKGNHD